jgi:glycosyltransferase involved in cell wall biosynthesis
MQHVPAVVSLDATPLNFDTIGAAYEAKAPTGPLGHLKFEWYQRIYHRAAALVTWSNWVKQSLVQDYGVNPDKVKVIPPGIHLGQWTPSLKEVGKGNPLRLLFVGADFERKGGYDLLEAFRQGLGDFCELDIVTKDETICSQGPVRVHRGLTPNSPILQQLFADADIFVFPTLGDTNAVAVLEAMASGLPVVTTNVGALAEEVEDGVTGFLVPTNDPGAIVTAIRSLANDPTRLTAMGAAGRAMAERLFNADHNYKALVDVLKECTQEANASKPKCLTP